MTLKTEAAPLAGSSRAAQLRSTSIVAMDTIVSLNVAPDASPEALERALGWFAEVERVCSRFDRASEVYRLSQQSHTPVPVSRLLFEAVRLALSVAEATNGLFDPTLGAELASLGFDRNYVTGERLRAEQAQGGSYRDVILDRQKQTITLRKPLLLDLGAVAKGLAIDLAARELAGVSSFSIDAGGDVLVKGRNPQGDAWHIGIAHPRNPRELLATLRLHQGAVCTSGDYERREGAGHHLLNPRTRKPAADAVSSTVVAPSATVADALSTAAFIAGPEAGVRLLESQQVDGLVVGSDLHTVSTRGFDRWLSPGSPRPEGLA